MTEVRPIAPFLQRVPSSWKGPNPGVSKTTSLKTDRFEKTTSNQAPTFGMVTESWLIRPPLPHQRGFNWSRASIHTIVNTYEKAAEHRLKDLSPEQWRMVADSIETYPKPTDNLSFFQFLKHMPPQATFPLACKALAREIAHEQTLNLAAAAVMDQVGQTYHTNKDYELGVRQVALRYTGINPTDRQISQTLRDEHGFKDFQAATQGGDNVRLFDLANTAAHRLIVLGSTGKIKEYEQKWEARRALPFMSLVDHLDHIKADPDPLLLKIKGQYQAPLPTGPNETIPTRQEMELAKQRIEAHLMDLRSDKARDWKPTLMDKPFVHQNALTPLTGHPDFVNLAYKREDLTAIGAYKIRGAFNTMSTLMDPTHQPHPYSQFACCSTGNHALAVLHSAKLLRPDGVRVVVPTAIPTVKERLLKDRIDELKTLTTPAGQPIQAEVLKQGAAFDDARQWLDSNLAPNEFAIPPYNHRYTIAGQSTIGMELLDQLSPTFKNNRFMKDVHVFCAIGGGGLLSGIIRGINEFKQNRPEFNDVRFHFHGFQVAKDQLGTTQLGKAIAVKDLPPDIESFLKANKVTFYTTSEEDMRTGMDHLSRELNQASVEGPAGATRGRFNELVRSLPSNVSHSMFVFIVSGGNA